MKKYLFLILIAGFSASAFGQTAAAGGAILTFENNSHDFGDMVQGEKVEHTFKFTNTGNEPLVITNVQVTCGCTTKSYPKDMIPAGGKGEIIIGFNSAGKMGRQNKVVTVVSNASNTDGGLIKFTANVLENPNAPKTNP